MAITAAYMVPHPPLIIPDVGNGQERIIQKTIDSYHETARRIALQKPETIILISPHQTMYADYFHISPGTEASGDFGQFRAPHVGVRVSYDSQFVEKLCRLAEERKLPAGVLGQREKTLDHGAMVPLYFVNQYWQDYQLVRIGLSGCGLTAHYELGQIIQEAANLLDRKTVVIASGDLSHRLKDDGPYGYREEGPQYDRRIMEVMESGEFDGLFEFSEDFCEKAGECGHRSFTIMAGTLDRMEVEAERLSYEGPFGVGYGICCYRVCKKDGTRNFRERYEERQRSLLAARREQEDAYVRLARNTIEEYVRTGNVIGIPESLPQEMYHQKAGVFVSIKKEGNLRGCIGTLSASCPSVAEEIIFNAISASTNDPRFSPIEPAELDRLTISVDVLGEMEKIDSPDMLDVKKYGVVVTKGRKRGLLLPNLDGIESVEEQIAIARQKAGIHDWETVSLERFEVIRHY